MDVVSKNEEEYQFIEQYLKPETDLERSIMSDKDYIKGLSWGKPRYGHPEGKVILHIREVLDNVDKIPNLDNETRGKLRVITLVHDSFKHEEDKYRKKYGRKDEYHHAVLAAQFLAKHTDDQQLANIILLHDEAYYSWKLLRYQRMDEYQTRLDKLLSSIGESLQLYYLFFKCDTQTGDKTQDPLIWFETSIEGINIVKF
jgi:hypothetical protein